MTTSRGAGRPAEPHAAEARTPRGSGLSRTAADADAQEGAPLAGSIAAAPDDPRQLEAEIERTRERLGETMQELVARADVKSRARAKTAEVTGRVKSTTVRARKNVAARAGSVRGQVAGMTAAAWRKAAPEQARRAVTERAGGAPEPWISLAIASGVLFAAYLALRQHGRR